MPYAGLLHSAYLLFRICGIFCKINKSEYIEHVSPGKMVVKHIIIHHKADLPTNNNYTCGCLNTWCRCFFQINPGAAAQLYHLYRWSALAFFTGYFQFSSATIILHAWNSPTSYYMMFRSAQTPRRNKESSTTSPQSKT